MWQAVSVVIAGLALLGSGIGFIVNRRSASRAADDAADARRIAEDAANSASRSAEAQERMADALERALSRTEQQEGRLARLLRGQGGRPAGVQGGVAVIDEATRPIWRVERHSGGLHTLENVGTAPAEDVTLSSENTVRFDAPDEPRTIRPGESVSFSALSAFGLGTPELVVTWTDPDGKLDSWRRVLP